MSETDEILTLAQVCAWLDTSADTIYRARKAGRFPKALKRLDRKPRWLKADIVKWLSRADLELRSRKAS